MAVYSIKELENLSGIKAHTIRIWEKRYGLIEPYRTTTNIRYYSDQELKKILNVAVLNRNGIKISNIARLTDQELKEEIMRVSNANPSVENTIDSLIVAMIDLDEFKFMSLLNKSIGKYDFKDAMLKVFSPFLHKVGILWQAGDVIPAQEHFVSNLIRQKIISSIESLSMNYNPEAKRFLLFLPENEWHEIGLLFAHYLLKEMGHDVLYLGQSVPYSDVLATGAARNFDCILVSSIIPVQDFDFITYLKDLGGAFPDKQIMFFSSITIHNTQQFGKNFHYLKSLEEIQDRVVEIYN